MNPVLINRVFNFYSSSSSKAVKNFPIFLRSLFELPKPKILGSIVTDDGTYHLILDDKYINHENIEFIFKP